MGLFFDEKIVLRELLAQLGELAASTGGSYRSVRDAGAFARGVPELPAISLELDLVYDPSRQLAPRDTVQGVIVDSLADLRANKLTCLLSHNEPRDLVDVLFLERAGHRPEDDLPLALEQDGGMDPGILAHLLTTFPVTPLLTGEELSRYRDDLAERLRRLAVAPGESTDAAAPPARAASITASPRKHRTGD